jgi:cephalosporin hydroxylase
MRRLTKLANKYKTDKGDDYWYSHGFTDFYEHFFEKFNNPTILEIGTAEGGSAKMLNDFFDGECTIYTLDIDNNCREKVDGYDNIKFFNVDCSNEPEILKFFDENANGVEFDIIIDDGSHLWDHQMLDFYLFSKKLKKFFP